jgi:glucose dehydrogenase
MNASGDVVIFFGAQQQPQPTHLVLQGESFMATKKKPAAAKKKPAAAKKPAAKKAAPAKKLSTKDAIKAANKVLMGHLAAGNAAAVAACYSKKALLMPPGAPAQKGAKNIAGFWAAAIAQGVKSVVLNDGANWPAYGRTSSEQRYSPLDQINADNVKQARRRLGHGPAQRTLLIGTPLVVDGVLYFTGSYSRTARSMRAGPASSCGSTIRSHRTRRRSPAHHVGFNRGPAFYKGKLIISTVDGRLVALDAKTGKMLWETMTIDPRKSYYITGAPKVFRDKVIIGNGGTEHEAARGYVTAYDIDTGKQAWRFYIVPGNPADGFENKAMEMAAKTWTGEWWKHGGGGNTWNGITYDPSSTRC